MRLNMVAIVTILIGLAFCPLLTTTTPRETRRNTTNKDDGTSEKINESISMLNNSQFVDDLKTSLKRFQQNLEEPLKKKMLPKQILLPHLIFANMIQPIGGYERNNTIKTGESNAGTGLPGGSLSPKLSYIRLMSVLIDHIWLTASEPPKEGAASSEETPKLTNNTIM
ncbi:uncharacterized protein [Drosophila pseudoobscura]|uniref:Uncharacterized protein n=1 Tax=Drosophila pseudoobscura pseudoobscura TaxID=46245 RepID=A0A6I8VEN6_DROPS|nr:uncharacterized protein LOC26532775 [Drosophila pseudoobscura]XP_015039706.2 uncharacterized protein LOC26532775 [Drosophila pseudoobscura]